VTVGETNMSGIRDSTMQAVSFRDSRLIDYSFTKTSLRGVSFIGGELEDLQVRSCRLVQVSMATRLTDARFIDCDFATTDLSGSQVQDVAFMDVREADIRLPRERSGFFITAADLEHVVKPLLPGLSAPVRDRVSEILLGPTVSPIAISEAYLRSEFGASPLEAAVLVDAMLPRGLESLADLDAR
jgi:hypothetical protein